MTPRSPQSQLLTHNHGIIIHWVAAQAVRWPGIPKVARSRLTECSKSCDLQPALHCAIREAQWVLHALCRVERATNQLDLPSLTPLSVAGCGWLQLGAPYWATSVNYCKYLIIEPTFCCNRFSTAWEAPGHRETTIHIQLWETSRHSCHYHNFHQNFPIKNYAYRNFNIK